MNPRRQHPGMTPPPLQIREHNGRTIRPAIAAHTSPENYFAAMVSVSVSLYVSAARFALAPR